MAIIKKPVVVSKTEAKPVAKPTAKAVVKNVEKPNSFDKKAYIKDAGKLYSITKSRDSLDKSVQGSYKFLEKGHQSKRLAMSDSIGNINIRLAKPLENYKKKK
jgi:hypothetical protein